MVYVIASTVTADVLSCYTNCKYRLVPIVSRYDVRPLVFAREFSAFMPQLKPKLEDHLPSFRILLRLVLSYVFPQAHLTIGSSAVDLIEISNFLPRFIRSLLADSQPLIIKNFICCFKIFYHFIRMIVSQECGS